ncbi:uncharacterized protein LOC116850251 isoform X2 [Odontomachus brunneus]|nr:uncharacterized protein LOC116850251 isoform X2 [Odontomachus brunneus]
MKEKVEYMLKEIGNDNEFEIEEEQALDFYDPNEIPHAETVDLFHHVEDENYLPEEVICTSVEAAISNDYKRQAMEYWRSGKTRSKSLKSVKHNYKQVTSLRQLRRWEKYIHASGTRREKLQKNVEYTLNTFNEALQRGMIIHDIAISKTHLFSVYTNPLSIFLNIILII